MADHSHSCVRPARRAFIAAMAALPVVVFAETAMGAGRPRRIICAGGDVCEIVYALGFGVSIIAGDLASRYTPGSERFAKLGPRRKLSAEGVLALKPDLFLYSEDSGPPSTIALVRAAGVPSHAIPKRDTVAGITEKIRLIARILNRTEQGRVLARRISADFADTAAAVAAIPVAGRKRVLFTHSVTGGRLSGAAGAGTPADAIIRLAGGRNALSAVNGYKPASTEAIVAARPDAILMAKRMDGRPISPREVFAIPALAASPAGRARRLIVLEGTFMLGFGPRTTEAIRTLAQALYPQLRFPPLRYR